MTLVSVVCVVGLLIFAFSTNDRAREAGKIIFAIALFVWFMMAEHLMWFK